MENAFETDQRSVVAAALLRGLTGNAQPGATKIAFTTLATYSAGALLRPSGLIGPVAVLHPDKKD